MEITFGIRYDSYIGYLEVLSSTYFVIQAKLETNVN